MQFHPSDDSLAEWRAMMLDHEIVGSTKCDAAVHVAPRRSLLVQSLERVEASNIFEAEVVTPLGTSAWCAINRYMTWDTEDTVGKTMLLWDHHQRFDHVSQYWVLQAFANDFEPGFDYHVDKHAVVLPVGTVQPGQSLHVLELFAGYYGGWHRALQHMHAHHGLHHQTIAIENDLRACAFFAMSHKLPIFDGHQNLAPDFFDTVMTSCILHADVTSMTWVPAVSKWHPQLMVMSPPCPPWSNAAAGHGLASGQGMIFPEALMLGKYLKPDIILVENVVGVSQHEHYAQLIHTMQHVGYKLLWSGTIELANLCPVKRPRWLALMVRVGDDSITELPMQLLSTLQTTNPILFKSVFMQPTVDLERLRITEDVKRILSDPRYAPVGRKRKATPQDVWNERCYNGWSTLPCFLASYGTQHKFVREGQERQCLAHVAVIGGASARYWHPIEILMHHMAIGDTLLPLEEQEAWKALGNQIAVPHAALMIHNALRMLNHVSWDWNWDQLVDTLQKQRINTANGLIQTTQAGLWITKDVDEPSLLSPQHVDAFVHFVNSFGLSFMPEGKWWSVAGLHDLVSGKPSIHDADNMTMSQVSQNILPTEADDTETPEAMPIYVPLQFQFAHATLDGWAFSQVAPDAIPKLWKGCLIPQTVPSNGDDGTSEILLVATEHANPSISSQKIVPCWIEGKLILLNVPKEVEAKPVLEQALQVELFDACGPLSPYTVTNRIVGCQDFCIRYLPCCDDPTVVLAAFHSGKVTYDYETLHDSWNVRIEGETATVDTLVNLFANSLHPDDLSRLGRMLTIEQHVGSAVVSYRTKDHRIPFPPGTWSFIMATAISRAILAKMPLQTPCVVCIKWEGRPIWEGPVDWDTSAVVLESLLQVGLSPILHFAALRMISMGKRLYTKVGDLVTQGTTKITMHAIPEIWGGAGPSSAKCQHRQQTKNSVAASLLEQGIELSWIHAHVDQMIDKLGIAAVVPAVGQPPGNIRHARIAQLFADAQMPLPNRPKKGAYAPDAMRTKQRRKTLAPPNPADYRLNCSYLVNEDGTCTQQVHDLRGQSTGALLTDVAYATPWLQQNVKLSSDELAMIVMGDVEGTTNLPGQKIVVPCFNREDKQVLVHATMFQMGQKQLRIKPWDVNRVTSSSSKVCSITLWAEDWTAEQWNHAMSKTNQFLKDILAHDRMESAIEGCWGRTLRRGKSTATVHDATSLQTHASITATDFPQFLAASGFNRLWVVPKEDGQLSQDYKVLWMPHMKQDMVRLNAAAAQLPQMSGLVKGRNSFGIRVHKASYKESWQKLFPDVEVPNEIPSNLAFKLEPLPYGTNPSQIREWAQTVGWDLKPVRPLGPRAWLITCGVQPPNQILTWNGNPLLPIQLQSRHKQETQTAIVAGPRARKEPGNKQDKAQTPATGSTDPWAQWIEQHPHHAGNVTPSQAAPARSVHSEFGGKSGQNP
eukprot:Skav216522  [mRNA]  locus=scaffold4485:211565:215905:- [translate_table: standard]